VTEDDTEEPQVYDVETPEEDIAEDLPSENEQSFIKFIEPDTDESSDDVESMRNTLRSSISEEEMENMYDDSVNENMSYKYSKKRGNGYGGDY